MDLIHQPFHISPLNIKSCPFSLTLVDGGIHLYCM